MYRNILLGSVHVVELRNDVERDTTTARSKWQRAYHNLNFQVTHWQGLGPFLRSLHLPIHESAEHRSC